MDSIVDMAKRSRDAARMLATVPTSSKNACLQELAQRIETYAPQIRRTNQEDVSLAQKAGLAESKLRRLTISDAAIRQMAEGVRQVAALDDPVGKVTRKTTAANGLEVSKVRSPLGVIMMIYEARPNVTVDAFALCFKSGNACILKGGREATRSNQHLAELIRESLSACGLPTEAIALLTTSDRDEIRELLGLDQYIDLVIPRGGTELIRFVHEHSRIPTVQHFLGVCHIFVDATADLEPAIKICTTAKTSAPAACNAVETILVHRQVAPEFVPALVDRLQRDGVEVRGDPEICALAPRAVAADEADWGREFLDLVVAVKIVPGMDAAIEHINRYGSNHTEAILSRDQANQRTFVERVQSSCTLVNASTRFNDGFQLGLGAEIGISTSKIHAYGPMGLEELTTQRYVVRGDGHVR